VILHQFYLNCLAHASYIVGDEAAGQALVVDPQRDIDRYLAFAAERGLRITGVLLTHLHADFLAGHLELRDRVGATIYLGRRASAEYPFVALGDGDVLSVGRVRLDVLETPGHTPESISLVVFDRNVSETEPAAVLTGDTLFVGDVGRPDLRVALGWTAADLGRLLFQSLHQKLLMLHDETKVYPAHGAGSLCGKALSRETVSTIGVQRAVNYALQPMSEDEFVRLVTSDQPDAPAYFTYDAVLNARERPTLEQALSRELTPLTIDEVLAHAKDGAQVLDTRDAGEFAASHLAGSLNIGLVGQYATWAGTLLGPQRPIVIVASPGTESESAMRLGRIGFDNVVGFLDDGLTAAARRPGLIASTPRLGPDVAWTRLLSTEPPLLMDVRGPSERRHKWIDGSLHHPLNGWRESGPEQPRDRPLLVYCAGGYRSAIAASLLQQRGYIDVSELAGGLGAWEQAGLPVASLAAT
jgi:hydroxyacylglutathione hydrolase